jgi:NTP pyrophosphatase (non-canonical NTP hydrolase)
MSDATLRELQAMVVKFRDERDWKQFHNFKDLAIKLSLEAAEVLEHVEWKTIEQLDVELQAKREAIGDELADVLQLVLLLAEQAQIDLVDAFNRKLQKNAEKYPVEKSKGSAKKYTEL